MRNSSEKVFEFIVLVEQPLAAVENEGFRRLTEHLETLYSLPMWKDFCETAPPESFKKACRHVSQAIKRCTSD